MSEKETDSQLLALTAQIVSAHIANNPVEADRVPAVIRDVYKTLSGIGEPGGAIEQAAVDTCQRGKSHDVIPSPGIPCGMDATGGLFWRQVRRIL